MAYRYTNTDKWSDAWFCNLNKEQKLLFLYLCDNCDVAGFIEINKRKWAFECNFDNNEIEGALEGLGRGLTYSNTNDCIYITKFLKHQKNLPLKQCNNAHLGIIKRFELYSDRFDIDDISEFIDSQMIRTGYTEPQPEEKPKGRKKKEDSVEKNWKNDFEIYLNELREVYLRLKDDKEWILEREKYNPNVDILLTLEKTCVEFWATEKGWLHKKRERSATINWVSTLNNSISNKMNKVYKSSDKNMTAGKILTPESKEAENNILNRFNEGNK